MKKYISEPGTESLLRYLSAPHQFFLSFITELELFTSVERFKSMKRINSPEYRKMVQEIEADFQSKHYEVIGLSEGASKEAKNFIRRYKLRAPDALQLAGVFLLSKKINRQVSFVCCDEKLKEAAILEGMKVFDPTKN